MTIETLFPLSFSPSMFSDIRKCELYFFRKHCQRFTLKSTNSDLYAGSLMAKACEIVRKKYFVEDLTEEEAIEEGKDFILLSETVKDLNKSNEKLAFSLGKYFQKFPLSEGLQPCKLANGNVAVEYEFSFDLGIKHPDLENKNILFKGKLDMLGEQYVPGIKEKQIKVIDEKTTGRISRLSGKVIDLNEEESYYRTSGQLIAYCFAAKQLGINVNGALIRKIPLLKDHEDAFELSIPINSWLIDKWEKSTFNKIKELVERYKYFKENSPPPHYIFSPVYDSVGCKSYTRTCEYMDGCTSKDGETELIYKFQQLIYDQREEKHYSIKEYKERFL